MKPAESLFSQWRKNHAKVSELLEKNEAALEGPWRERRLLFTDLQTEIEIHFTFEQTILFSGCRLNAEAQALFAEAENEQALIEDLTLRLEGRFPLDGSEKLDPHWVAQFAVLKETIEHHIAFTETELFPMIEKLNAAA